MSAHKYFAAGESFYVLNKQIRTTHDDTTIFIVALVYAKNNHGSNNIIIITGISYFQAVLYLA